MVEVYPNILLKNQHDIHSKYAFENEMKRIFEVAFSLT